MSFTFRLGNLPLSPWNFFVGLVLAVHLSLTPLQASAGPEGVSTGNGSFITGIQFVLRNEHPYHLELMQMLEKAQLPSALREAVLTDLSSVSILYSDESLTYQDLQDRIKWDVVTGTKRRTDRNGQITEETVITYDMRTTGNQYGLFYSTVGEIKTPNFANSQLAALTSAFENKVIYFTTGLKQLTKEEQLVIVLHEQAHRLSGLFGERSKDERFVEGWAQGFYNYLAGRSTQSEFYGILNRHGISTFSALDAGKLCVPKCFANERMINSASGEFEAQLTALIKPQHINLYGPTGREGFSLVLDPSAFANYPLLANKKEISLSMKVSGQAAYDLVTTFIERARSNPSGEVMHFRVSYRRILVQNEDTGKTEQKVELYRVLLSTEDFSNQLNILRESAKPYFSKISIQRTETPFILLDNDIRMAVQEGLGQLILWTNRLSDNLEFARDLKFLNARVPQTLTIDPLTSDVSHFCQSFNGNEYFQTSWQDCIRGFESDIQGVRRYSISNRIGLRGLVQSTLDEQLTFKHFRSRPVEDEQQGSVQFLLDEGTTQAEMDEFLSDKHIVDLQKNLISNGRNSRSVYISFLAESKMVARLSFVDSHPEHQSVNSSSLPSPAGLHLQVDRRYRKDPQVFARIVRSILKNRDNFTYRNNQMYMREQFVARGSGRRIRVIEDEWSGQISVCLEDGAAILRGLGLE